MAAYLPVLLLSTLLAQSPAPSQECSISGHVYSSATGLPLKKANVRAAGSGVNARLSDAETTTDREGSFRIDHLKAGQYTVLADRNGYLSNSLPRVACGTDGVAMKLPPQGMIFGRVVDDDEPAPANVTVYRRTWSGGQRRLQQIRSTNAQADGSFVVGNLTPGNYYLSAHGTGRVPRGQSFIDNYYPNMPDVEGAAPIAVAIGGEVRGIELHVRIGPVYTFGGKGVRASGEPANGARLMLANDSRTYMAQVQNGVFRFNDVLPGSYVLQNPLSNDPNQPLTAYVPVTVVDRNVEDFPLVLAPGAEIRGELMLDDTVLPDDQTSVEFEPVGGSIRLNGRAKQGIFALHGVTPTRYRVTLFNLPAGYCVKSMRFEGRDAPHGQLDLSSGAGGKLEIQLSAKPAAIEGTVRDSDGNPVFGAAVGAWMKDEPDGHGARTDEAGHFVIRNLPPGEYRITALESIDDWMMDVVDNPEFRASFSTQATAVTLQESSHETVELKAVPKAAIEEVITKLP